MLKTVVKAYLIGILATITFSCLMAVSNVWEGISAAIVYFVGCGLCIGLHALASRLSRGRV